MLFVGLDVHAVVKVVDTQLIGNLAGAGSRTCRGTYDANPADRAC